MLNGQASERRNISEIAQYIRHINIASIIASMPSNSEDDSESTFPR